MMTCSLNTRCTLARTTAIRPSRKVNVVAMRASAKNEVADVAKAAAVLASPLLFTESASAAMEVAQVADARPGLLLFPLAAALGWVLFNIAGPTKNQIDNMSNKAALVGAGLTTMLIASSADAAVEVAQVADARPGLLFFPLAAALGWVLFNIAGPTKNQIDNMSQK